MELLAALRNAAHSEPSATVSTTDQVSWRAGSGLCTEPKAHTAPEMMPSSGGSSVNGRASWTYTARLERAHGVAAAEEAVAVVVVMRLPIAQSNIERAAAMSAPI